MSYSLFLKSSSSRGLSLLFGLVPLVYAGIWDSTSLDFGLALWWRFEMSLAPQVSVTKWPSPFGWRSTATIVCVILLVDAGLGSIYRGEQCADAFATSVILYFVFCIFHYFCGSSLSTSNI